MIKDEISIIVPVYNEENAVGDFLNSIKETMGQKNVKYEIIAVDDGSADRSFDVIKDDEEIVVLRHEKNRGYGAALKTGIRKVRYETIIIIDADGSYSPKDLDVLLNEAEDWDMIVGDRVAGNKGHAISRSIAKWFLKHIAQYLSGRKIPDLNSGLRIFPKKIAEKYINIFPDGFSFTTTITMIMLCNYYKVKFVPIEYHRRIGKSKIRPVYDTINFIKLIVQMSLYFNPIKIFVPVSLLLLASAMVIGIYQGIVFRNITTITVIIFMSGLQIGMLGLLSDLIDKRTG
ncbi:glycosyltransferase family 2 protein [Elusimicrobiota bacterium]